MTQLFPRTKSFAIHTSTSINNENDLDYSPTKSPPGKQLSFLDEKLRLKERRGSHSTSIIENNSKLLSRSPTVRPSGILKAVSKLLKNRKKQDVKEVDVDEKESNDDDTQRTRKKKAAYDYTALLMYIPDGITPPPAATTKKYFSPFNELVKTGSKDRPDKLLDDIIKASAEINLNKGEIETQVDKLDLVKKVLEFNKKQKKHYVKQVATEKRNIVLPVIKQTQDQAKLISPVKVLPSRRLYENSSATGFGPQEDASTSLSKAKSSPGSPKDKEHERKKTTNSKFHTEAFEQMFIVHNYKFFWYHSQASKTSWRPDVREGHTFTAVGRYIVLYGGLNNTLLDDIVYYDPVESTWEKPQVTGEIPQMGRHGHTAVEYKRNLIIFGGEQHFNSTLNLRECLNDIRMFSPDKNEWKYVKTLGLTINPRRYHAATTQDKTMYVYGGINNEGIYIRDLWTLNLKNFSWDKVEITGDKDPGIAFHTMCACAVDRSVPNLKEKDKQKISEEGIYVFGGKDGEGRVLSTLKMFSFDSKTPHWKYPDVKGAAPTARYNHSMMFYEPLGLLIIYGGRNDSLYEATNDICLNDIRILNLEQMAWQPAASYGDMPQVGRYHQAVAGYAGKMLIFGGVEFRKYADDEVKSVELNQPKVRRIIDMDQIGESTFNHSRSNKADTLPPINKEKNAMMMDHILYDELPVKHSVSFLPVPRRAALTEVEREIKMKLMQSSMAKDGHHSNILSKSASSLKKKGVSL